MKQDFYGRWPAQGRRRGCRSQAPTCRLVLDCGDLPAVSSGEGRCQAVLSALMLLVGDSLVDSLLIGAALLLLLTVLPRRPPNLCSLPGNEFLPCRCKQRCVLSWRQAMRLSAAAVLGSNHMQHTQTRSLVSHNCCSQVWRGARYIVRDLLPVQIQDWLLRKLGTCSSHKHEHSKHAKHACPGSLTAPWPVTLPQPTLKDISAAGARGIASARGLEVLAAAGATLSSSVTAFRVVCLLLAAAARTLCCGPLMPTAAGVAVLKPCRQAVRVLPGPAGWKKIFSKEHCD